MVRILKDLEAPIDQKHVLIVEDIVDSGQTLNYLVGMLKKRDPLSIRVCTLLNKVRKRDVEVELAYEGFTIPLLFVVGYGMDYAQLYRNLPYIGILKPEAYSDTKERPEAHHKHPVEGKDFVY